MSGIENPLIREFSRSTKDLRDYKTTARFEAVNALDLSFHALSVAQREQKNLILSCKWTGGSFLSGYKPLGLRSEITSGCIR